MRFTTAIFVVALPFLVIAAPRQTDNGIKIPLSKRSGFNLVDEDGVVDIAALNAHVAGNVAKFKGGFTKYENNTAIVHRDATKRASGSGVVPLSSVNSQLWHGTIAVGTPGVPYTAVFDTGSSDVWLAGRECFTACFGHRKYLPGNSKTARDLGKTFSINYTDGAFVTGDQYTDTIQIGSLTADAQTLGAATYISSEFTFLDVDGAVGLGFQSISAYNARPIVPTLKAQGQLGASAFGLKLGPAWSELSLGGPNPSFYTGDFTYTPVTNPGYWAVKADDIRVEDKVAVSGSIDSIFATSSTVIVGDTARVATFYNAIGGTDASSTVGPGFYTLPCDKAPKVSLTFGGRPFPIPPTAFFIGRTAESPTTCVGGIVASDAVPAWLIGDNFLAHVYSVFDYDNTRVGFATLS